MQASCIFLGLRCPPRGLSPPLPSFLRLALPTPAPEDSTQIPSSPLLAFAHAIHLPETLLPSSGLTSRRLFLAPGVWVRCPAQCTHFEISITWSWNCLFISIYLTISPSSQGPPGFVSVTTVLDIELAPRNTC